MAKGGHNNKVCAIKTLSDYNSFVSCGWDQNLIFWDIRKKEPIDQCLAEKVAGEAIDAKGNQLLMGYARLMKVLYLRSLLEFVGYSDPRESQLDQVERDEERRECRRLFALLLEAKRGLFRGRKHQHGGIAAF